VNLILFDFNDTGVGDDVYLVVLKLFLCIFADFLIVSVENVGLRLDDMD
jgi:hypothetical protein